MSTDKPLKSAYELAMERLKTKDREEGVAEAKPLTAAQKARIAELRQEAQAKLAEMEILHRKNLEAAGGDPAAVLKSEDNYRTDRARVESRLESALAKVKAGG
jgi:uncharacterized protein YecT (DUF1311 family)